MRTKRWFRALAVAFAMLNAIVAAFAIYVVVTAPWSRGPPGSRVPIVTAICLVGPFVLVSILAGAAAATGGRRRKGSWWLAIAVSAADQLDGLRLGYDYRSRDPGLYVGMAVLLAFVAASVPLLCYGPVARPQAGGERP